MRNGSIGRIAGMVLLLFLLAPLAGFAGAADDEGLSYMRVPFERGSQEPPLVSVFYDLDYSIVGVEQPCTVIACIWSDGRAVWSGNRTKGGPPYFAARISPEQVRKFVAVLNARVFFERKFWFERAVDAPHHDINVVDGPRRLAMSSSAGYTTEIKTPFLITKATDALACFRQQLEQLLPREGKRLRTFEYEIRPLP